MATAQELCPCVEQRARAIAGPDRHFRCESGGHLTQVAVPATLYAATVAGHGDHLLVKLIERRKQQRATVWRDEQQRCDHCRAVPRQVEAAAGRVAAYW